MVYIILNVCIVALLFAFSSTADNSASENQFMGVINFTLVQAIAAILNTLCLVLTYWNNYQLINLLGKLEFVFVGCSCVNYSMLLIRYPVFKNTGFVNVLKFLLYAVAIAVPFLYFERISYSLTDGIAIESAALSESFSWNWFTVFIGLFLVALPVVACLSILLRLEVTKDRMIRSNMLLLIVSTLGAALALHLILQVATKFVPAYVFLYPMVPAGLTYFVFRIMNRSMFLDIKRVARKVGDFILSNIIPGVVVGVIIGYCQAWRGEDDTLYILAVCGVTLVTFVAVFFVARLIRHNRSHNQDLFYEAALENDLSAIDYNAEDLDLNGTVVSIIRKHLQCHSVEILLEDAADECLKTTFTTGGKHHRIPLSSKFFDAAQNENRTVIVRDHVENHYRLPTAKDELLDLFQNTASEVLIILQEGRHVFGAILLGPKTLGNLYSDYDYSVLTRLYSYFFVIGFYMRNKANEEVIGTVNREISMSGQIIQSIQENLDFINNPKFDVGYISIAAHNLGGEYYDFIRLSDTRHLVILGDFSGKGINASMSTVICKSVVRTYLEETHDFKQLVVKVNSFIRNNLPKGTFFAGVFALIDFETNEMFYINCGIPALFMYNQAFNNVVEIQGEGRVLGFARKIRKLLKVKRIDLNPGDMILMTTDGLLNGHSIRGETFGRDRTQHSLVSNMAYPADKICQFAYQEMLEFTSQELEDDVSVITIKCLAK